MADPDNIQNLLEQLLAQADEARQRAFLADRVPVEQVEDLVIKLTEQADAANFVSPQESLQLANLALTASSFTTNHAAQGVARLSRGHALRWLGRHQEALVEYRQAGSLLRQAELPFQESRSYLGELASLSELGQYADCIRRGKTIRRRMQKVGDTLNAAKLETTLAVVDYNRGDYKAGLRRNNRVYKTYQALGEQDWMINTRVNRANNLLQLNRVNEAATDYQEARQYFQEKGRKVLVAVVDENLGALLFKQGRYNEALTTLTNARDGFETNEQPDKKAQTEISLGNCYAALGLYDEAFKTYDQAGTSLNDLGLKYETLWAEIGQIQALISNRDLVKAADLLARARGVLENAEKIEQNDFAAALLSLFEAQIIYQTRFGDLTPAITACQQAQSVFSRLKMRDWQAQSLLLEADLLRLLQRWNEAESLYRQAYNLLKPLNLPHLLYQFHLGSGKLKQAQLTSDASVADKEGLLTEATEEFLKATQQVETIRAVLRPEELRTAYMENGLEAYEALVEICVQDAQNPARLQDAFTYVERSKSRTLLDLLSNDLNQVSAGSQSSTPEQTALATRIEQLRRELNWFYSQIHNQSFSPDEEGQRFITLELDSVAKHIDLREKELANLISRRRLNMFQPLESAGNWSVHRLSELRVRLTANQSLIEYYVLADKLLAFVITNDKIELFPDLCQVQQIVDLQEKLNYQANKFNLGKAYIDRRLPDLQWAFDLYLRELHTLLMAPLLGALSGEELIIVPHSTLHTLPFHALYDGERYLIEKFEVSYAPSSGVLLHCLNQEDYQPGKLLALAVPDENLPGVETEVKAIAPYFEEARLLVGETATLAALEANLEWCDVLHLASHGIFREDNPLFSMLKLYDSWLSVHDVSSWHFKPTLVTLSACQTGLNRPFRGDELLGLVRGFLSAGAYALVVSLWSVSDEVTTYLMQFFYEALLSGEGRAKALRTAMLKLRQNSSYAHPHYWAPFLVVGHP